MQRAMGELGAVLDAAKMSPRCDWRSQLAHVFLKNSSR
jgi:hypothetical protein